MLNDTHIYIYNLTFKHKQHKPSNTLRSIKWNKNALLVMELEQSASVPYNIIHEFKLIQPNPNPSI